MKAPFPYAGGKSKASSAVWSALGDVANYIEPFAGSLAVLLARPHEPKIETVNDRDGLICNVWRAIAYEPEQTAALVDYPVSEIDLHARHQWLVNHIGDISEQLRSHPKWCNVEAAAWWIWGACQWMGGEWCAATKSGVHRKRPIIGGSHSGKGVHSAAQIHPWFAALSERLRRVRIVSGDFERVLTPSTIETSGDATGVFLDPPYSHDVRAQNLYADDDGTASERARNWAIANGDNPRLRIVLAGLEGEHEMPRTWKTIRWNAPPGLGLVSGNRSRERLWLSPQCNQGEGPLFGGLSL